MTKEEMEGPTSSWGSRNRLTCLTLQEHDDDDDLTAVFYVYVGVSKVRIFYTKVSYKGLLLLFQYVNKLYLTCTYNRLPED